MATKDPLFLITSATGNTGRPTVEFLRDAGHHVRAFVHTIDDRSKRLHDMGVELFEGDLQDFYAVSAAMALLDNILATEEPCCGHHIAEVSAQLRAA